MSFPTNLPRICPHRKPLTTDHHSRKMTITQSSPNHLQITLRQNSTEVANFLAMAMLIGGALAFGVSSSLDSKIITLLIVLFLAGGWSAYALGCSEQYSFDRNINRYAIARLTPLGKSASDDSLQNLAYVSMETGGPDDNRRLVVLVESTGRRIPLPRRINSLSEDDQRELGRAVSDFLNLPLRKTR